MSQLDKLSEKQVLNKAFSATIEIKPEDILIEILSGLKAEEARSFIKSLVVFEKYRLLSKDGIRCFDYIKSRGY